MKSVKEKIMILYTSKPELSLSYYCASLVLGTEAGKTLQALHELRDESFLRSERGFYRLKTPTTSNETH